MQTWSIVISSFDTIWHQLWLYDVFCCHANTSNYLFVGSLPVFAPLPFYIGVNLASSHSFGSTPLLRDIFNNSLTDGASREGINTFRIFSVHLDQPGIILQYYRNWVSIHVSGVSTGETALSFFVLPTILLNYFHSFLGSFTYIAGSSSKQDFLACFIELVTSFLKV